MNTTTSALSRAVLAAATSLTLSASAALLVATPAHAEVVIDCLANSSLRSTSSTKVTVRGANNIARVIRLPWLKVVGPNNVVVVKQGRTKVSVTGANNRIRVNKRA